MDLMRRSRRVGMDLMRRSRAQARPGDCERRRGGGGSGERRRRSGRRRRGGRERGAQAGAGGDGRRGAARSAGRAAAREHLPQHEHPAPAAPGLRTKTRRRPVPPHPTGCRPARGACVRAAPRALTRRARQHIFMARSDTAGWGAFVKHAVEKHEFIQVPARRPAHAARGARCGRCGQSRCIHPFRSLHAQPALCAPGRRARGAACGLRAPGPARQEYTGERMSQDEADRRGEPRTQAGPNPGGPGPHQAPRASWGRARRLRGLAAARLEAFPPRDSTPSEGIEHGLSLRPVL
jgi:hypothetical protein